VYELARKEKEKKSVKETWRK